VGNDNIAISLAGNPVREVCFGVRCWRILPHGQRLGGVAEDQAGVRTAGNATAQLFLVVAPVVVALIGMFQTE
jgi:hypothetical protein